MRSALSQALTLLPENALVGLITYGTQARERTPARERALSLERTHAHQFRISPFAVARQLAILDSTSPTGCSSAALRCALQRCNPEIWHHVNK